METDLLEVVFTIQSPTEIVNGSALLVTKHTTFDKKKNDAVIQGGLMDLRMGAFDMYLCQTCNETRDTCQGHYGHIELAIPMYNSRFTGRVKDILDCVCHQCSRLRVDWENLIGNENNKNVAAVYRNLLKGNTSNEVDKLMQFITNLCKKITQCPHCGYMKNPKLTDRGSYLMNGKSYFSSRTAYKILCAIDEESVKCMGLGYRPEWLMYTAMKIISTSARPSMYSGGEYCDNVLTNKYAEIIKANRKVASDAATSTGVSEVCELTLQDTITQLLCSKQLTKSPLYMALANQQSKGGAPKRIPRIVNNSLDSRLQGKDGRMRKNLMGKRVDFNARTVITGDATLDLDQLGVPKSFAVILTFPEVVNQLNIASLQSLVYRGTLYPGANQVRIAPYIGAPPGDSDQWQSYHLQYADRGKIVLKYGDIVERQMVDDDVVVFNRQPSLHKMSLMGHRVVIMDGSTFRLNLSQTTSYNAGIFIDNVDDIDINM